MKNNRINSTKMSIFLAAGLFTLLFLCQPSVYGQITPQKKAPVIPSRSPASTATRIPAPLVKPTPTVTKAPVKPSRVSTPAATKVPFNPPPAKLVPKYAPVEVDSSKYGVIRIRIENQGQQTEVPKGISIRAILTIVDISSNPPRDTGCGAPRTSAWNNAQNIFDIPVDKSVTTEGTISRGRCIFANAHLTQPLKPGESKWVIANFAATGVMDQLKSAVNRILTQDTGKGLLFGGSGQKITHKRLGALIEVGGATKNLVTALNESFY